MIINTGGRTDTVQYYAEWLQILLCQYEARESTGELQASWPRITAVVRPCKAGRHNHSGGAEEFFGERTAGYTSRSFLIRR